MTAGLVRVVVSVPFGAAAPVLAVCRGETARRKAQMGDDPRWYRRGLAAAERDAIRGARAAWLAEQRRLGVYLDTVGAVLAWGSRVELRARGWDADWPPSPGLTGTPGRWWGSQQQGLPEQVAGNVPVELVEQVRAACWHASRPAIRALQDWREDHPGHLPRFKGGALNPALVAYEELAVQVTAPGDIWRRALDHAVWPRPRPVGAGPLCAWRG